MIDHVAGLVQKARQGDLEAYGTLVSRFQDAVYGAALARLGNWHEVGEDEEHVAILDLLKLSRALKKEFQARLQVAGQPAGRFSLQMEDEIVSFEVVEGKVTLGKKKQRTHVELPRWIVTRTYMGYSSGEDALQRVGARLPARARRLFCALFPRLWPCSIPDFNFWFPEKEWRAHSAKKRREIASIHWPWLE